MNSARIFGSATIGIDASPPGTCTKDRSNGSEHPSMQQSGGPVLHTSSTVWINACDALDACFTGLTFESICSR